MELKDVYFVAKKNTKNPKVCACVSASKIHGNVHYEKMGFKIFAQKFVSFSPIFSKCFEMAPYYYHLCPAHAEAPDLR